MMSELFDGSFEEYADYFKEPSAILHGHPIGISYIMPRNETGGYSFQVELEAAYLNALLVDIGSYVVDFSDVVNRRFESSQGSAISSLRSRVETMRGVHKFGRPDLPDRA